jgi:SAM-dependent methyltransferase
VNSPAFSKAQALRRDVLRKIRQVGLLKTARHVAVRLLGELSKLRSSHGPKDLDSFDLQYGTDTAQEVTVGALGIPDEQLEQTNKYQAVGVHIFANIIRDLPIRQDEYRFVDLGSGKGRALLLASEFPFKEVIGVELSGQLHEIACRNIKVFSSQPQRCRQVRSICADAGKFQVPDGNVVVYMYNSFGPEIMRMVLSNIRESLRTRPRNMYVVYANPQHREVLDKADFLKLVRQGDRYLIYERKG